MKRLFLLWMTWGLLLVALAGGNRLAPIVAEQGAPFNPHGRYSAATNSCTVCHVPHSRTTDPEAACRSCHPRIVTHREQTCATCHAPHGNTPNAALIQAVVRGKPMRFDGKNFDAAADSICRTCHTTTAYHSATARSSHYEQQPCTNCHPHSAGFSPNPENCGACHGFPPASGAHNRHRQADIGLTDCQACHPQVRNWRDPGHYNGRVDFKDRAVLATTGVCNACHGNAAGIAEAKANWSRGRPLQDCTGCHNSTQPGRLRDRVAPAVDAFWTVNGHGQGHEQGRDLDCQACHNPQAPHFDTAGNPRLWDTPAALCARCHQDPARAGADVSAHGNQGYAQATQRPFGETCDACHNPHGSANLAAVRAAIRGKTVVFIARTGANSFDSPNDENSRDLCATCHTTTRHNRTPSNRSQTPHYEGQDCGQCHKHETDGDPRTADAFMPQGGCMACHSDRVDNGDNIPPGGRPEVATDFAGRSHHIKGDLLDARCVVCHDMATHGDGYIDLRHPDGGPAFRFLEASATDLTAFCQACHDGDGSRVARVPGAQPADPFNEGSDLLALPPTNTHSNRDDAGRQGEAFSTTCNECHAGHGSSNLALVRTAIRGQTIVFTARTGANSFDDPDKDDRNDLCATCHIGRTRLHPGGDHRPAGDLDLRGTDCTTCHRHDADNSLATRDGFMPSCGACHGNPPPPAGSPLYTLNENLTPHRKHAGTGPGEYGLACSTCHNRLVPSYTGHVTRPPSFQDVFFDALNPIGSYDRQTRTCATLGCHSNGNPTGGQLIYRNPVWAENSRLDCAGCHGDQATLATGSHAGHLLPFYRDRGADAIGCFECHALTAQNNDNNALADLRKHVNLTKDVQFDVRDLWGRSDNAVFDPNTLTCANSLCHSDGAASREQPDVPVFSTPKWGDRASGTCGTCHSITPQTMTSGAHARHFDTSNQGPGITSCSDCHSPYGSTQHVNGKVEFADGKTLAQTTVCDACHSPGGGFDGVAEARANWATSRPVRCEGCHDAQPAVVRGVTAPNVAGDGRTYGFALGGHGRLGFTCATCHEKGPNSIHFDGVARTYTAAADNLEAAKWLGLGGLKVPITAEDPYVRTHYAQCYVCHLEANTVGLGPGYSNALFTHSVPPPPGYPLIVDTVVSRFRNERPEGFNFGNVPANIHWDHLDMNMVNWDSDGDGTMDSKPSCVTCHDPHGVKSFADGVTYPAMTIADMGIVHGQDAIGAYGEVTQTAYNNRCRTCHPAAGIRYYRP